MKADVAILVCIYKVLVKPPKIVESQTEFIPVASLIQFEEALDFTAGFVNRQCSEKTPYFVIESPYFYKPLNLQFPLLVSAQYAS